MSVGLLTEWTLPTATPGAGAYALAVDSGGDVYFTTLITPAIGRLRPATDTFTEWTASFPRWFAPQVVAVRGKTVFFTDQGGRIGRFVPQTGGLTVWDPVPARWPIPIATWGLGVDAAPGRPLSVWCALDNRGLARLDVNANVLYLYDFPAGAKPRAIAVERSGIVWIGDAGGVIMRFDPGPRKLQVYANWPWPTYSPPPSGPVPSGGIYELGLRVVDEDTVMFTEDPTAHWAPFAPGVLGVIHAATSTITEWPTPIGSPWAMSWGLALRGWFTDFFGNKIEHFDGSIPGTSTIVTPPVFNVPVTKVPITPQTTKLLPQKTKVTPTVTSVPGVVSPGFEEFTLPTPASAPNGIQTFGSAVFFAEEQYLNPNPPPLMLAGNKIGRLMFT